MWAHYADNNKGVVLELNCIDSISSPWLVAKPVIYRNEISQLDVIKELVQASIGLKKTDLHGLFKEFLYVKKSEWEYEKEWRVVSFKRTLESGLYSDYTIDPLNFNAVYFGVAISEEYKEEILTLLKYDLKHVLAYEMSANYENRKLQCKRIK